MSAKPPAGACIWHTADAVHIDVRGLAPPEPMIAILRMLDGGSVRSALIAHLDRAPIFLYPELDDRGWCYQILSSPDTRAEHDDEVVLRMERPIS